MFKLWLLYIDSRFCTGFPLIPPSKVIYFIYTCFTLLVFHRFLVFLVSLPTAFGCISLFCQLRTHFEGLISLVEYSNWQVIKGLIFIYIKKEKRKWGFHYSTDAKVVTPSPTKQISDAPLSSQVWVGNLILRLICVKPFFELQNSNQRKSHKTTMSLDSESKNSSLRKSHKTNMSPTR